jgi:hypothetical protein
MIGLHPSYGSVDELLGDHNFRNRRELLPDIENELVGRIESLNGVIASLYEGRMPSVYGLQPYDLLCLTSMLQLLISTGRVTHVVFLIQFSIGYY